MQATKLSKAEKVKYPKFLNSAPISEYIASIDDDTKVLASLYSSLCSIAHPSYESNCVFLALHAGGSVVYTESSKFESESIVTLLKESAPAISNLFRRYYNILHSTMLVLNRFRIRGLAFVIGETETFEKGVVWQEFEEAFAESEKRYLDGLQTGHNA